MINIELAETLRSIIAQSLVYFPTIVCAGYGQAWLTKKLGDDTAYELGYMTLNPAVHFDPLGFFFLVFLNYGFGRPIPINPYDIHAPLQKLKTIALFWVGAAMYFMQSIIGLILMMALGVLFYKSHLVGMSAESSTFLALKFILERFLRLNIVLTTLFFIWGFIRMIIFFMSGKSVFIKTDSVLFWVFVFIFVSSVFMYVESIFLYILLVFELLIGQLLGF